MTVPYDTEPTEQEVFQQESPEVPIVPIPVVVEGPVNVRQLPAVMSSTQKYSPTVNDAAPTLALNANPRRKMAIISCRGQIAYMSTTAIKCNPNDGFIIPAPSVLPPISSQGELYIIGGNAAASEIGVYEELWTN